ncbi:hypothetical protein PIB30_072093, partial [Stylosanthes scabra]|nr:hypothetical protein [Stylosanthes scabra]
PLKLTSTINRVIPLLLWFHIFSSAFSFFAFNSIFLVLVASYNYVTVFNCIAVSPSPYVIPPLVAPPSIVPSLSSSTPLSLPASPSPIAFASSCQIQSRLLQSSVFVVLSLGMETYPPPRGSDVVVAARSLLAPMPFSLLMYLL